MPGKSRRIIYIKNPSSGSHFRVLGGSGGGSPMKPPKPPRPPLLPPITPPKPPGTGQSQDYRPPKPKPITPPVYDLPTAPTMHSAGNPLQAYALTMPYFSWGVEATTVPLIGQFALLSGLIPDLMIGGTAIGGAQFGAGLIAAALIAGYTIPQLPGWGQPISFFSVLNEQNGATAKPQIANLQAAWDEVMAGLNFNPPTATPRPISPGQNGSIYNQAGNPNVPPPNYGTGGDAIVSEVWRITHGQGFTKASEQMNYSSSSNGNNLFSP